MTDGTDLTEAQKAYNIAQNEMFQLAAYGHYVHHPSGECLTDEGRRQQRNYLDHIRAAQRALEAAVLRLVADHAEREGRRIISVGWLWSLADDPSELSLLALRSDGREEIKRACAATLEGVTPEVSVLEAERDMVGREADRLRKDWVAMREQAEQAQAAAAALSDQLKHARDLHRETCLLARGAVPSVAFTCGICEALTGPAIQTGGHEGGGNLDRPAGESGAVGQQ